MKKILVCKALRHQNYDVKALRKAGFKYDPKEGTLKIQLEGFTIDKPCIEDECLESEAVASV
jgi:hypothetical protein